MGRVAADDVTIRALRSVDLTGVQREVAAQYQQGNVVRYRTRSRRLSIAKGSYAVVVGRDVAANRLTVRLANGDTRTYDPRRLKGVEVYSELPRRFAAGDRIQFRAPLRSPVIPNGALATVVSLTREGVARLELDDRTAPISLNLNDIRHLDYGYAVTSYSSQGKTVDRALVAVRTEHAKELVNTAQVYVSISRARREVEVFTDSRADLPRAASREAPKHSALTFGIGLTR